MFEDKLAELYQKIASKVDDMIPIEWNSVILGADLDDYRNGGVYFFFDTLEDKGNYIYNAHICSKFNIDKNDYGKIHIELFFLVRDLREMFIEYDQEPWYTLIMKFNRKGELEAKYEYIDWDEGGFDPGAVINYFKAKHLGCKFDDEDVLEEIERMSEYASRLEEFENTKRELVEKVVREIKKYLGDLTYEKIVFDGRINDGTQGINFYIKQKEGDIEFLSLDEAAKIKNSTSAEIIRLKKVLLNIVNELRNLCLNNNWDEWFSMMISEDNEIGIDWEFTYSNWYELNYNTEDIINYFKFMYLDIEPKDKNTKKVVLAMKKYEDEE